MEVGVKGERAAGGGAGTSFLCVSGPGAGAGPPPPWTRGPFAPSLSFLGLCPGRPAQIRWNPLRFSASRGLGNKFNACEITESESLTGRKRNIVTVGFRLRLAMAFSPDGVSSLWCIVTPPEQ